jgi:Flp pilus assembly protein TadG
MRPLRSTIRRLRDDASADIGHILIITAVMMFGLLIMAAFSVDVGQWYDTANRSQRAADNASLAAVKELVVTEQATGSRATAEAAAQAAAESVAAQNGFDVAEPGISVTTTFRQVGGSEVADVVVNDSDVPTFFAGVVLSDMQISRDAEAIMAGCEAVCGGDIEIPPPLGLFIDADAQGDGYQAERVGDYFFNIFHHQSGDVLQCTDVVLNDTCAPGGDTDLYPAEPYQNVDTNYTPKLEAFGDKVYWIAQHDPKTRLGCWDSTTHAKCTGFSIGVELAPYRPNKSGNQNSRINGPDLVNGRLYAYGDDNRMYCYDPTLDVICAGYPANTSLAGAHDMELEKDDEGFDGGVKTDGMQFDTVVHADGRIWHSIGPTDGDEATWIGCWNTNTAAPCAGWTDVGTDEYLGFLYFTWDTAGNVDGVCARGGKEGGDKPPECFTLTGADTPSVVPWDFKDFGEQSATAIRSNGDRITFFPDKGDEEARCWNWTTQSECGYSTANWSSTNEYSYTWDGGIGGCVVGLGHSGRVWSFRVDDGQAPCEGNSTGQGVISACTCADSGVQEWTSLSLSPDTDLSDFASFLVSIRRPDGSLFTMVDLVAQGSGIIDLSPLNTESPVVTTLTITATAITIDGETDTAWFGTDGPVLVQNGGTKPTLLS